MAAEEDRREEAGKNRNDNVEVTSVGISFRGHLRGEEMRGRAGVECITKVIRK